MEMRWRNICVQGAMLGLLLLCFSLLVSGQTLDPLEGEFYRFVVVQIGFFNIESGFQNLGAVILQ